MRLNYLLSRLKLKNERHNYTMIYDDFNVMCVYLWSNDNSHIKHMFSSEKVIIACIMR